MLKKLYIHNFKSFWNSSFEFGKVNCLIAPNNSGKSNLIEALEFCDKLLFPKEDEEKNIHFTELKNFRHNEENITFKLEFELVDRVLVYQDLFDYKYSVKFNIISGKIINIDVEVNGYVKHITIFAKDNKNIPSQAFGIRLYGEDLERDIENYERYDKELNTKKYTKFDFNYSQNTLKYELVCPSTIKGSIAILFALQINVKGELIRPIKLKNIFSKRVFASYDFQPYLIKKESFSSFQLNKNGTNLVEFIAGQLDETIEDISTSLIGEVEQVTGIVIDKETAFTTLSFIENDLYKVPLRKTSDGTVYFLAIMSALISNESSTVTMMFEEPERHMHMKVLSYILSSMRDCKSQIFFTTHSGELLKILNQNEIIFLFRDEETGDTKGLNALKIKSLKKVFETNKYDISEIITNEVLGYIGDYDV